MDAFAQVAGLLGGSTPPIDMSVYGLFLQVTGGQGGDDRLAAGLVLVVGIIFER
jgi:hypothetical protein